MHNGLILDTCGLIWLVSNSKRLSSEAKRAIDSAQVVFVSSISAWEISLKVERGKLELPLPALQWFKDAIDVHDLRLYELSPDILVAANELDWHHNDPADRFIIATAIREGLTIVSADSRFEEYGVRVIC